MVLQLLAGGPKTRQELAALQTKYPLCSICSVVGALLKRGAIEEDKSVDLVDMGNGEQSMRTRLRIKGR